MIAAADLEDAEFERDRLAMACGEAIRQALADGFTPAQIAHAANMAEAEVHRLAEAPSAGPDVLGDALALRGAAGRREADLVTLQSPGQDALRPREDEVLLRLEESSPEAHREPDAAR
ncbi:hypothetical protein MN0502_33080 [Arthrobacter sp. MN05-02]|nr:hypothetical protein MN0502_33080 [Arthrobacter sp. MN05-02]